MRPTPDFLENIIFNSRTQIMDLFSNDETLGIVPTLNKPSLSKAQKAFNTLIKRLEKQRAVLRTWEKALLTYRSRMAGEWLPAQENLRNLRREWVLALDRAANLKSLGKADRHLARDLVCDYAAQLADVTGDADMKALYTRHRGVDFDEEAEMTRDLMVALIKEQTGVDIGDDVDLNDQQSLMEGLLRGMGEQKAPRRKTAKQLAKEERGRAEEQRLSQSLREVYRKLASALHPDREPDAEERARKTDLMQRVNLAYENKDLLALLELQLELEHIDQDALRNMSEERLKHFNQILKNQLQDLESQAAAHAFGAMMGLGLESPFPLSAPEIFSRMDQQIEEMREECEIVASETALMQDATAFRAWIKAERRRQPKDDDDYW